MSNHDIPAEIPDDLELEEHDALDERGARASRNGRKSTRDFLTDDDGGFGGGRSKRNTARRDEGKEQRRREAGSREEPPFQTRAPMSPAGGFQRNRDATPPYASGGSRVAERPRPPYPDRFDRGPARPMNGPAYGAAPAGTGNRGPVFRPARPMNDSQPPRPPMAGRDAPLPRDNRPLPPRFPQSDARPSAPQQARPQQRDARVGYGSGPVRSAGPAVPPPNNGGSRTSDATPRRPDPCFDRPRQFRRDAETPDPGRR